MGVNLLPQASEQDIKKVDSGIKGFIGVIFWMGILIVIFVILFLIRGLESGTLEELESSRATAVNRIAALGQVHDDYYTLAYKTSVLDVVRTKQYRPSVLGNYVDSKIGNRAKILGYGFDATGFVSLQIEADNFISAMRIWNDLLTDKQILVGLDLKSFSTDKSGKVQFQLRGQLNLEALYARNAEQ